MTNKIPTLHLEEVIKNHGQDMIDKVVVITGTTSGTGFVCARELAKKWATVVLLNRKSERSQKSLQELQESVPEGDFDLIDCDLQDLASVKSAVDIIKSKYDVIDVLVNNAGVMALKDYATIDGFDIQMQTNIISHFFITKELFPLLKKSTGARIINHSSMARLWDPLEMKYFEKNGWNLWGDEADDAPQGFRGPRWARYHQSKLANAVFTYALKNKLQEADISNIIPLLAHPGLARTNLQIITEKDGWMDASWEFMNQAQSAEDGATGIIRATMDKEAKSGNFYGPVMWVGYPDILEPEDILFDKSNIDIFWNGCETAVWKFEI